MTTPLFLLRCVQIGLSISDLDFLTIGLVNDLFTEKKMMAIHIVIKQHKQILTNFKKGEAIWRAVSKALPSKLVVTPLIW
jgi:hypothetical protein